MGRTDVSITIRISVGREDVGALRQEAVRKFAAMRIERLLGQMGDRRQEKGNLELSLDEARAFRGFGGV